VTAGGLDAGAARLWQPGRLEPMLARRIDEPFASPDFLFEIKWDGYRCLAFVDGGVYLQSRGGLDMSPWFPEVAEAVRRLDRRPAIVDGEVVAWREGRPDFGALQRRARLRRPEAVRRAAGAEPVTLVLFDVLVAGGRDVTHLTCEQRRRLLAGMLEPARSPCLALSEAVDGDGPGLYRAAQRAGLEGIVAKRRDSVYQPGRRSGDWLKVPHEHRRPVVIGGVAPGRHYGIGAFLVGAYDPQQPGLLTYLGDVGAGLDRGRLAELVGRLRPAARCPFHAVPSRHRAAFWVQPEVVCVVGYREVTADRRLRHPVFRGLDPAAAPQDCVVPWGGGEGPQR